MARLLDQYNTTIAPALADEVQPRRTRWRSPSWRRSSSTWASAGPPRTRRSWRRPSTASAKISGQKPLVTKAKVSVAGFRLREGNEIGCKVTLRGQRMYEFLDRLVSIALPRIRDFRGVNPNSFDGHGNYTLGLAEQVVFPEIDADRIQHTQGMDITIVTHDRQRRPGPRAAPRPSACRSASRRQKAELSRRVGDGRDPSTVRSRCRP